MVHFSISYRIFTDHPNHAFLLGCISPDAVDLRQDKESKAKSHLHDNRGSYPEWLGLLHFYNTRVNAYKDEDYKWFLLGYLSHIIADHQWVVYKRKISNSDQSILKAIWTEEAQNDFNLYRTVPWLQDAENKVNNSPLYELNDIYSLDELDKWRREIFTWLETDHNEPHIENQYLQGSNVGAFIKETSIHIKGWMQQNVGVVFNSLGKR